LDELEQEQASKIGAYSIQLPYVERKPQVLSYFENRNVSINESALQFAFKALTTRMPRNLYPVSVLDAYVNMPKGTNQGAPFFSANEKYREGSLRLAQEVVSNGYSSYRKDDPCLLYWRGQPRGIGESPKQRTVWGYPHWITILELTIQMALLKELKVLPEFSAWVSGDRVADTVTSMFGRAKGIALLSVDFSGFDASVPQRVVEVAFDVLRYSFHPSAHKLIDLIEERFLNIGLWTPEGILLDRKGAVPSGSGETNLIDSICHMLIAEYVGYFLRNEVSYTVQGDDGVWQFRRPWQLDEVSSIVGDFGMVISSDKGGVNADAVYFLQNIHLSSYRISGKCVGIRPILRVLNGMMSYERLSKSWTSYDDTIRWFQQCEAAKYHPKFHELAKFLYDHDKYSRSMTATEIVHRGGGLGKIARDLKQDSFPYGKAPLSGLYEYRIVQELASIRDEGTATRSVA